jgi:hypothetical protein
MELNEFVLIITKIRASSQRLCEEAIKGSTSTILQRLQFLLGDFEKTIIAALDSNIQFKDFTEQFFQIWNSLEGIASEIRKRKEKVNKIKLFIGNLCKSIDYLLKIFTGRNLNLTILFGLGGLVEDTIKTFQTPICTNIPSFDPEILFRPNIYQKKRHLHSPPPKPMSKYMVERIRLNNVKNESQHKPPPKPLTQYRVEKIRIPIICIENLGVFRDDARNEVKGISIYLKVNAYYLKNVPCRITLYFWKLNNHKFLDKNGRQIRIGTEIIPKSNNYQINNLQLFMPYNNFKLGLGIFRCKFNIIAYSIDNKKLLDKSENYFLLELVDPQFSV